MDQTPSTQQLVYDVIAACISLLGALGMTVPAAFTDHNTMWTIAGLAMTVGATGYSLLRHDAKTKQLRMKEKA